MTLPSVSYHGPLLADDNNFEEPQQSGKTYPIDPAVMERFRKFMAEQRAQEKAKPRRRAANSRLRSNQNIIANLIERDRRRRAEVAAEVDSKKKREVDEVEELVMEVIERAEALDSEPGSAAMEAADGPKGQRFMKRKLDDLRKEEIRAIEENFRDNPAADPREYGDAHNINLHTLNSIIRDSVARRAHLHVADSSANGNGREPQPAAEPGSTRQSDRRTLVVGEEEYHELLRNLKDSPDPAAAEEPANLPTFWQPPANGAAGHVGAQTSSPAVLLAGLVELARRGDVKGTVSMSVQLDLEFSIGGDG